MRVFRILMVLLCFSAFLVPVSGREYLVLDQRLVINELPETQRIEALFNSYVEKMEKKIVKLRSALEVLELVERDNGKKMIQDFAQSMRRMLAEMNDEWTRHVNNVLPNSSKSCFIQMRFKNFDVFSNEVMLAHNKTDDDVALQECVVAQMKSSTDQIDTSKFEEDYQKLDKRVDSEQQRVDQYIEEKNG